MADNTDNTIVKKQKRDSQILESYNGKCDTIIEKYNAFVKELIGYMKDDVDEYEKQVAHYDDARQLIREAGGLSIILKSFKRTIEDGIHTDGQDNVKKIHDLAKELYPAMNLASCSEADIDYSDRIQWP